MSWAMGVLSRFLEVWGMGVGEMSRGNGSFVGDYGSFLEIGSLGDENSRFGNEGNIC